MAGVNKVLIIGNLGRDPEIKYTQNNVPVANFSVATTESWKDKNSGEWQEKTEGHRIVAWRQLEDPLSHAAIKPLVVDLLKCPAAEHVGADLPDEQYERGGILLGHMHAGAGVGGAALYRTRSGPSPG